MDKKQELISGVGWIAFVVGLIFLSGAICYGLQAVIYYVGTGILGCTSCAGAFQPAHDLWESAKILGVLALVILLVVPFPRRRKSTPKPSEEQENTNND